MNTVKDSWDDEDTNSDSDIVINLAELQKLENRKKEEEADHELTEDLFAVSKQQKTLAAVIQKQTTRHLQVKAKPRELVSKRDENERKIKQKVAVKKQVVASKQKHAAVFGDAELDELQDEYCDYEDRY